jgi:thiol peroxidase
MASVTLKGNPVQLSGNPPQVGDKAPDFSLTAGDLSTVSSSEAAGKVCIISVIPSIDTPVCSIQTKRFNQEIDALPDTVAAYTVSVDTPFAQKRWCGAEGVEKMKMLSDYKGQKFGQQWGLYIEEPLGALARAVYVVDKDGTIAYAELVPEIAQEPNYDGVFVCPVASRPREMNAETFACVYNEHAAARALVNALSLCQAAIHAKPRFEVARITRTVCEETSLTVGD